jgi:hypothetical protein
MFTKIGRRYIIELRIEKRIFMHFQTHIIAKKENLEIVVEKKKVVKAISLVPKQS